MTEPSARKSLFAHTIARPVATTMVTLAVATFGMISFRKIPLELLPEISYPSITVRTEYPGAGPEDIEERVTKNVEQALAVLPGLVAHSSTSRPGVSDVLLEFQWDKSLSLATQEVRERLDRANLPSDVKTPLVLRYDPSLDPVLRLAVFGDQDLAELRVVAEETIGRALATVSGVAAVKTRGGLETEIRVRLDNRRLSQLNLDISEVDRKLRIENVNLASGRLIEGDTEYLVRTLNEFQTLEEILELGVAQRAGQPIRLKDIATVERTAKERDVITRAESRESVELQVFREADANIVELSRQVKERLFGTEENRAWLAAIESGAIPDPEKQLVAALDAAEREALAKPKPAPTTEDDRPEGRSDESAEVRALRDQVARKRAAADTIERRLPRGVSVRALSDQAVFIENAIEEVKGAALLGGLLSIVVLLFFLRDLSATTIISVAIPLSIIATFACMYGVGTTLNIMSLGGLALGIGMLVDNSIVVLESIVRCREEGDGKQAGAIRGTSEVGSAVLASTLTTVAVFFPIAFVSGIAGQIFKDQALTVVFSLTSSLFVALFFVPMLAARFASNAPGSGSFAAAASAPRSFLSKLLAPVVRPTRLLAFASLKAKFAAASGARKALRIAFLPVDLAQVLVEWIARVAMSLVAIFVYALVGLAWTIIRLVTFVSRPFAFAFDATYRALARAYVGALGALIGSVPAMLGILLLSGAVAWLSYGRIDALGKEMLPEVHQGELIVQLDLPVGTPVEETASIVLPLERSFAEIEGVVSVSTSVGIARDEVAGVDEGSHTAKLLIRLDTAGQVTPAHERAAAENRAITAMRAILSRRADLTGYRFSRPTLFSVKSPMSVEARGEDLERLKDASAEIERRMAALSSLSDVRSTVGRGNPEILLTLDRDKMLRFGLDIEAISNRIRAQVQGVVSTRFPEGERRIDIRVKSDIDTVEELLELTVNRGRAVDLADTLDRGNEGGGGGATGTGSSRSRDRTFFPGVTVDLGSSAPIPLRQIADIKLVEGPSEVRRINGQRAAVVSANTVGFDVGATIADLRPILADIESRYPGVTCAIGGQGSEMGEALDEMRLVTLLAIFLVYLVMASQFESIVQPLLIMGSIPLALVGAILALDVSGTPISVVALIGAVVLAGIVVNNAIVLVDYTNQLRGRGATVRDALVEAGKARLRPILMTTGTTVLGLLPLTGVLENIPGITRLPPLLWAGSELQAPLAVTVIGGLALSTLLTLVVIPSLYALHAGLTRAPRVDA